MDCTIQQVGAFAFGIDDAALSLCSSDSSEWTGTAELLDGDCFCLIDVFLGKKRNLKPNCWKRADALWMSPTTSLLLLWPQTCSYSCKNITRACPSHVFLKSISSARTVLAPLPCWQPPLWGNVFVLTPVPRDHNCMRTWKDFSTYIRCFKKIPIIFCFQVLLPLSIFAKPVLVMPVRLQTEKTFILKAAVSTTGVPPVWLWSSSRKVRLCSQLTPRLSQLH